MNIRLLFQQREELARDSRRLKSKWPLNRAKQSKQDLCIKIYKLQSDEELAN